MGLTPLRGIGSTREKMVYEGYEWGSVGIYGSLKYQSPILPCLYDEESPSVGPN